MLFITFLKIALFFIITEVKKLAGKLVEQWLKFIKSGQAAISDVAMAAVSTTSVTKPAITVLPSNITVVSAVALNSAGGAEVKKPHALARKVPKPGIQVVREVSSSDEEEVPPIGSLPLYKITVRDGKSVLAKVGTKTLSLPVTKKTENEVETSNTVTSVVLKSDPISKKFRYVTKSVADKEKLDASELLPEDSNRDKNDVQQSVSASCEALSKQKIVGPKSEKEEVKKVDEGESQIKDKEKSIDSKTKLISSKSDKGSGKLKDGHTKISKPGKEHETYKCDSKYKDKERKLNRDSEKDKKKSDHKSRKTDKSRDRERDREKDKSKNKEKDSLKEKHKDSDKNKLKDKHTKEKLAEKSLSAAEKAQIQADKDKDTLERLKTPAISLLGKIPKKPSSQNVVSSVKVGSNNLVNKTADLTDTSEKVCAVGCEVRKPPDGRPLKVRPKTVKTFNSKFRSTGLEEEIKPPPPRSSIKKKPEEKRPSSKSDSTPKSITSPPKDGQPPEKKAKLTDVTAELKKDRILEKPGGIKLIPPKPKRKSLYIFCLNDYRILLS